MNSNSILKKQVARKTLYNGLAVLGFTVIAFFVLFLVNRLSSVVNSAADWYLYLFIALACAVEWVVLLFTFAKYSSEDGEKLEMSPARWILALLPIVVLAAVLVVLYCTISAEFFTLSGINFIFGLVLMVFVVALLSAAVLLLSNILPKRDAAAEGKEMIMKVVGKNDPDAANALGTVTYEGMVGNSFKQSDHVFPDLISMDEKYRETPYEARESDDVTLEQLSDGFMQYLESKCMFYSQETIRSFLSGMACSRLIILEGISGMGKTSLPRYFSEYAGTNVTFTPVQSSWRDRGDVLGYYNDFVGTFKETPFLRALYKANYETDEMNLIVLDEMNLSRVEYYFADFLSVLELDEDRWQIELMPLSTGGEIPEKLEECSIRIPNNVWFIGTANNDDTTHAMSDKVYDRAISIDFVRRKDLAEPGAAVEPLHVGSEKIAELFDAAAENPYYKLDAADIEKFTRLTDFVLDAFDVSFGNRIQNQMTRFVPVYVACGGTREKALDTLFSRKILRKLGGRFDDEFADNLDRLEKLILELYGERDFSETLDVIAKLKRKMF